MQFVPTKAHMRAVSPLTRKYNLENNRSGDGKTQGRNAERVRGDARPEAGALQEVRQGEQTTA